MEKEITLELVWKELQEVKKLLTNNIHTNQDIKIQNIINTVNEVGSITVNYIMESFNVSRPYALELMKKIEKENYNLLFLKGGPYRSSSLVRKEENKLLFMAHEVDKDMKEKQISSTMSVEHLSKVFKIDQKELQDLISALIKTGRYRLEPHNNFWKRRIRRIR